MAFRRAPGYTENTVAVWRPIGDPARDGGTMGESRRLATGGWSGVIRGLLPFGESAGVTLDPSGAHSDGGTRFAEVPRGPLVSPRSSRERLVGSLNHLAGAISSTLAPEDILSTVVDEVKELVRTDKAILSLLSSAGTRFTLDESAVFVRGCRDEYTEDWWREHIERVVAESGGHGAPRVVATPEAWLLTVPVKVKNRPIGVLAAVNARARRFGDDDVALMEMLAATAGVVIENARLHAESNHALLAEDRDRIAKEMHDGLSQSLFSASLEIDVMRKRCNAHPEETIARLEHLQTVITRSLSELRRYIHDLRPVSLHKLGLIGAIDHRAQEIGLASEVSTRVYVEGDRRSLPPSTEACAYRVAQEAVANAVKHARPAHVWILVKYAPTFIELRVEDDGCGFDVTDALRGVKRGRTLGLQSMQDRVQAEGGDLTVASSDRGTTIGAMLPC